MTRKSFVFTVLLLLVSLLSGTAGAEEPALATPTDLECAHEQTKTTIYFFDSPAYTSMGPDSHRVSGPATVETACAECGEILSSETVANAEEIRPHRMKNSTCVLCGYKDRSDQSGTLNNKPAKTPGERIIIAGEDAKTQGLLSVTLTYEDLYELSGEGVSTVLIKGKNGDAAVALNVSKIIRQTELQGANLYLELAEREDGSLFAGMFLVQDSGTRNQAGSEGITLRFYRQSRADVRISLAPAGADSLIETEGMWNEKGYWSVPYLQEGTYFLLQ
ncbi:MAG: hypothetical protein IKG23_10195 [Clostridia bacterium]|nr:hypothetical protein [Clostridia bacterium]